MSIGGVFQLVTNTGVQDQMIMQTKRLTENIKQTVLKNYREKRLKNPDKQYKPIDCLPDLVDIDRTHVMFIKHSFKPFVAMAHEYTQTLPSGGIPKLSTVDETFKFNLPIVGDFINDAVLYVKLTGFSAVSGLDKVRYAN